MIRAPLLQPLTTRGTPSGGGAVSPDSGKESGKVGYLQCDGDVGITIRGISGSR